MSVLVCVFPAKRLQLYGAVATEVTRNLLKAIKKYTREAVRKVVGSSSRKSSIGSGDQSGKRKSRKYAQCHLRCQQLQGSLAAVQQQHIYYYKNKSQEIFNE